ncbi:hyccin-like [Halichondria panicea]|uniref:hyccin-like n=1 Tax=Halichondria panicea TaxID=6063 RepID=UPI00312B7D19
MDVINQFEKLKQENFEAAVKGLLQDVSAVNSLRNCLRSQVKLENITLFEWLFNCIQLREKSSDLFRFILQFLPDLLLVYLHAVYESNVKLKAMSETPLLGLLMEIEKNKPPLIQVPTLAKPSMYHKATVQPPQSGLTEANLLRHNQADYAPTRPTFANKIITVNNRLLFLSTVMNVFADHITTLCHESRVAFCEACVIIGMQGMGTVFLSELNGISANLSLEELYSLRRYSVSDSLITSLLRGLRMCLFQSCHPVAMDALRVLKLRAEYELLTVAIQTSHALSRLAEGVKSMEVPLDISKQSSYYGEGSSKFEKDSAEVHIVLNSHVLHCKLLNSTNPSEQLKITRSTDV